MQHESNFRSALLICAAALGNFAGCNGDFRAEADTQPSPATTAHESEVSQLDAPQSVSDESGGGAWPAALGTWCGPGEARTLWLTSAPDADTCDAASRSVYSAGPEAHGRGLSFELDAAALDAAPAQLRGPGRYCSAADACVDVEVTLQVERYTAGKSLSGAWTAMAADHAEWQGTLEATWCDFDAYLPAHPGVERLARDIAIKEVAVYQGVKVPIARDLQAVSRRNADLVQNRDALVRIFVEPRPGFTPRELSARLTLQDEGEPARYIERSMTVAAASTDEDGSSTFNLKLPKDAFRATTQYAVELRETSRCTELAGAASGARFPERGLAPVGARATGPVKVMLVPVRYDTDGSGRLPDLSPEQLALMSERLYAMYPTSEVMLSVRELVGTDRTELRDMLDQMRELRATDAPPSDLSYYGLVRQADTFLDYCQGACTTGIAGFGSQAGAGASGMGVGYPEAAASTFVHELGHIYRRPHAPCGNPSAPDEAYPYPNATLGSWGYDLQTHELFSPATHADFMSYCAPDWISDFNYQQLLERIVVMNQRASFKRGPGAPRRYRTLLAEGDGHARWGLELGLSYAPPGDPVTVEALDAEGTLVELVSATFEAQPDGEQAYFVPAGHDRWHAIRVPGVATLPYAEPTRNVPFRR